MATTATTHQEQHRNHYQPLQQQKHLLNFNSHRSPFPEWKAASEH